METEGSQNYNQLNCEVSKTTISFFLKNCPSPLTQEQQIIVFTVLALYIQSNVCLQERHVDGYRVYLIAGGGAD